MTLPGPPPGEFNSKSWRSMRPIDYVPCGRCGLRGHVAADCDLRIDPLARSGLGPVLP